MGRKKLFGLNVRYDNILSNFKFQVAGLEVKVTAAIFINNFDISLSPVVMSPPDRDGDLLFLPQLSVRLSARHLIVSAL